MARQRRRGPRGEGPPHVPPRGVRPRRVRLEPHGRPGGARPRPARRGVRRARPRRRERRRGRRPPDRPAGPPAVGKAPRLDYLLGRNALGPSHVTGYGTDFTRHQRTRHFAHDLDPSFPPPPSGALVGGPGSKDNPGFPSDARVVGLPPQRCYLDESTSETTNDVCIRWNAPLVWMAAFLTP